MIWVGAPRTYLEPLYYVYIYVCVYIFADEFSYPLGKAAAVSCWDGKEIDWQVWEKMKGKIFWHEMKKHGMSMQSAKADEKKASWFRRRWGDMK
jgi:hypothetical protein